MCNNGRFLYAGIVRRYTIYMSLKLLVLAWNKITKNEFNNNDRTKVATDYADWNKKEFHKKENCDARVALQRQINITSANKWEEERPFTLQVEHLAYYAVVSWMLVRDK
jgi:hypothetical protein